MNIIVNKTAAIIMTTLSIGISNPFNTNFSVKASDIQDVKIEYADIMTAKYLNNYDVDEDGIYLSNSFNVYSLDESKSSNDVYMVFENDKVVGMLSVADLDGEYYSSFEYSSFELLQNCYDNKTPFCFVSSNEALYAAIDMELVAINNQDQDFQYDASLLSDIKKQQLKKEHKVDISVEKGDVNIDGKLNAVDASLILVEYADLSANRPAKLNKALADYNSDGIVDAKDASLVLVEYAKLS